MNERVWRVLMPGTIELVGTGYKVVIDEGYHKFRISFNGVEIEECSVLDYAKLEAERLQSEREEMGLE